MKIKTIFFDIGGVVVNSNFQNIYYDFAQLLEVKAESINSYHSRHMTDLLLGNITLEKFFQDISKLSNQTVSAVEEAWLKSGLENRKMNKPVVNLIKNLGKRFKVYSLTNASFSRKYLDDKMFIYSLFDQNIISCIEHIKKPDTKIFELALNRTKTLPEETLFVDDNLKYIESANSYGIKILHYTMYSRLHEEIYGLNS